jgi:hypothetical protein
MASRKKAATKKAEGSGSSAAGSESSTVQKPLATGDVDPFPQHTFRADMGEGLPPQQDTLNPDRAK